MLASVWSGGGASAALLGRQALPALATASARSLGGTLRRMNGGTSGGDAGPTMTEEERAQAGATGHAQDKYQRLGLERMFDLTGRTAFVTGAAQGMGKWIALGLARCGAHVVVSDFGNQEKLAKVAQYIRDMGRKTLELKCDVRDRQSVESAVERAAKEIAPGGLHILVANAGILGKLQPASDVSPPVWNDVMETNLHGVYHCCRAAYPYLKASGGGKIILMSSIAGIRGFGAQVAYCASKGALLPLAKSLAVAWGRDNIQVNCLLPGAINTPFLDKVLNTKEKVDYILGRIPAGRLGVAEDVVGPAIFLASHASDYVTGAELVVDGGGTALPMLGAQDPEAFVM